MHYTIFGSTGRIGSHLKKKLIKIKLLYNNLTEIHLVQNCNLPWISHNIARFSKNISSQSYSFKSYFLLIFSYYLFFLYFIFFNDQIFLLISILPPQGQPFFAPLRCLLRCSLMNSLPQVLHLWNVLASSLRSDLGRLFSLGFWA